MFADRKAANNAYAADPLLEDVLMNVMVLAEQGDAESQYNLALMYERGDIVTQDYKEAVKWYRLAAEQEYVFAQFNLGLMYKYGKGVTRDYKEAVRLYLLAAEQGNARAQQNLGVMYYEGLGVIKNIVISYMWLNIAASKGEKNAKNNLGVAKRNMTSEQIAKAQELARECIEKNYKDCG